MLHPGGFAPHARVVVTGKFTEFYCIFYPPWSANNRS